MKCVRVWFWWLVLVLESYILEFKLGGCFLEMLLRKWCRYLNLVFVDVFGNWLFIVIVLVFMNGLCGIFFFCFNRMMEWKVLLFGFIEIFLNNFLYFVCIVVVRENIFDIFCIEKEWFVLLIEVVELLSIWIEMVNNFGFVLFSLGI